MRKRRRNRGVRVNLDSPTMDHVDLDEGTVGKLGRSTTRANALNVNPFVLDSEGTSGNRTSTRPGTSDRRRASTSWNDSSGSSSGPMSDRYGPSATGYADSSAGFTDLHSRYPPQQETDAGSLMRAESVGHQARLPPAYHDILPDSGPEDRRDGGGSSSPGAGGDARKPTPQRIVTNPDRKG